MVSQSVIPVSLKFYSTLERTRRQWRLVGEAIGGPAHCNEWYGLNGTESNVVSKSV